MNFQVGLAKDDALTHQLIDYLMGEVDGIPKVNTELFINYLLRPKQTACFVTPEKLNEKFIFQEK